jgi:hypothetical protein
MRPKLKKLIWIAPAAIAGMVIVAFIGGEIVMLLWNWLLPPLFGWREITFWQGLGLLALCRILFGGHGLHSSTRSRMRTRMEEHRKHRTAEERDRLRQAVREHWGAGPSGGETQEL